MESRCFFLLVLLTITCVLTAQEQVEIDGAMTIGDSNSSSPAEGTIRWNSGSQDFEGYNGVQWLSLTNGQNTEPIPPPMSQEEQYSTAPLTSQGQSGYSVAISGIHAFVGSPADFDSLGSVHVFKYLGDQWIENQTLIASNGVAGDGFGSSIAVSDDKLIIGAHIEDEMGFSNRGKVYFFHYDGIDWVEDQWKDAAVSSNKCLDINGTFAIVGQPLESKVNSPNRGFATIYEYNGSAWHVKRHISDSIPQIEARLGSSVAISEEWAVIGAASYDGPATVNQGKIKIYKNRGNIWQFETEILGPIAQEFENFGYDVAISGDTIAVSAIGTTVNGKQFAGSVYMYSWDGSQWVQFDNITIGNPSSFDFFGQAIDLYHDDLIISAHLYDAPSRSNQGIVVRYAFNGSNWKIQEEYFDPDNQNNGEYGWSLDTDGVHRIVGMPKATIYQGSSIEYGKVVIGPMD